MTIFRILNKQAGELCFHVSDSECNSYELKRCQSFSTSHANQIGRLCSGILAFLARSCCLEKNDGWVTRSSHRVSTSCWGMHGENSPGSPPCCPVLEAVALNIRRSVAFLHQQQLGHWFCIGNASNNQQEFQKLRWDKFLSRVFSLDIHPRAACMGPH